MLSPFDRKKLKEIVCDHLGRGLTIALFHETNDGRTEFQPVWYLRDWKEVYMELSDPTEYKPAMYLIGDWSHWKRIADGSACAPYIALWREELRVKMKSDAIEKLKKLSEINANAAKWLVERQGEEKKNKKQRKIEDIASFEEKMILADAERLKSAK